MLRMKKLFEEALKSNSMNQAESSEEIICELLNLLHLPCDAAIDLQKLLIFSISEKKNRGVHYDSSKEKQNISISTIRQQLIELTKKYKIVDEYKVKKTSIIAPPNDNTTNLDIMTDLIEVIPIHTNNDNIYNDKITK